jgi:hypothetical protein
VTARPERPTAPEHPTAPARTPKINGLRVAHETFWHGLGTEGLIVRGRRAALAPTAAAA